jgi:hypothetical protein
VQDEGLAIATCETGSTITAVGDAAYGAAALGCNATSSYT